MKSRVMILAAVTVLGAVASVAGTGGGGGGPAEIDGVVSLTPVGSSSCLAAWVPVPGGQALAGVGWYNNDEQAVFPQILVVAGTEACPGDIGGAVWQAADCAGPSSGWAEVEFAEPVASSTDGLYVVFVLPPYQEQSGIGAGGGPGLGYQVGGGGAAAWLSPDGQEWVRICPEYRLAVEPVWVAAVEGMRVMRRLPAAGGQSETAAEGVTALLPPQPNPFNPQTRIRFTLADEELVELAVYDVRGRKAQTLATGAWPAGSHELTWTGTDARGRPLASGTYLLRLRLQGGQWVQRLQLVR